MAYTISPIQLFIKRAFDIVVSFILLSLLWPLFLAVALILKYMQKSDVLYTQVRVGQFGKHFRIYKFKSMIDSVNNNYITTSNDPRITPFGTFLRKYKIDELPQLYNVLRGDMSFVGPRPDVPGFADKLVGDDKYILLVRPGITGPASIFYRNEEYLLAQVQDPETYNAEVIWPSKVRINLNYVKNLSFGADLYYIFSTIVNIR